MVTTTYHTKKKKKMVFRGSGKGLPISFLFQWITHFNLSVPLPQSKCSIKTAKPYSSLSSPKDDCNWFKETRTNLTNRSRFSPYSRMIVRCRWTINNRNTEIVVINSKRKIVMAFCVLLQDFPKNSACASTIDYNTVTQA